MFIIAVSLSIFFGFISQTLLSSMGVIIATLCICVFIFLAVLSDMLGIAVATADIEEFERLNKEGVKGASTGLILCQNAEKMCSFCADVVGDICSTLSGAGGACIIVSLSNIIQNPNLSLLASTFVSALIAGITVLFKALMKESALRRSNKIILKLGYILESTIFREKVKKKKNKTK